MHPRGAAPHSGPPPIAPRPTGTARAPPARPRTPPNASAPAPAPRPPPVAPRAGPSGGSPTSPAGGDHMEREDRWEFHPASEFGPAPAFSGAQRAYASGSGGAGNVALAAQGPAVSPGRQSVPPHMPQRPTSMAPGGVPARPAGAPPVHRPLQAPPARPPARPGVPAKMPPPLPPK
eukprot:m51a1_g9025 hypothetical protein (176) ;mRNA; r:209273-209800